MLGGLLTLLVATVVVAVPDIPSVITEEIPLISLWHKLDSEEVSGRGGPEPRTILSPNDFAWSNMVPLDLPHPLYDDSPDNLILQREILHDYLVPQPVNALERLSEEDSFIVYNFNSKPLRFERNPLGEMTVNDVVVEDTILFGDNTYVYVLQDLLFGQREVLEEAATNLNSDGGFQPEPFFEPDFE